VELDFRKLLQIQMVACRLISMNLADLFIMAVVYNHMLSSTVTDQITSYFNFFAPGLAVTGLFASAFRIGREVTWKRAEKSTITCSVYHKQI